jgi:hypothetical protein
MTEMLRTRVGHVFHRMAVPLVAYYTVTLALPLLNGAAQAGVVFLKHAIVVLVVPAVAIVGGCALDTMLHICKSQGTRHEAQGGHHKACL